MLRRCCRVSLVVVVALMVGQGRAETFHHECNLYGDWQSYLYSATNAEVYHEKYAGTATYWRPTVVGVTGEIIYRFPLTFPVQSAHLGASLAVWTTGDPFPYDPGAQAYLDVSPNGSVWTNTVSLYAGHGGFSYGPGDITPYVAGTEEIWVRARLKGTTIWGGDGPIFAQFMRTYSEIASVPTFTITATAVPEPSTIFLILVGALLCGIQLARRYVRFSAGRNIGKKGPAVIDFPL